MSHHSDTGYAWRYCFPRSLGLIGQCLEPLVVPFSASILEGCFGLAMLLARLPELYRAGGGVYGLTTIRLSLSRQALVGAAVGGIAGLVGRILSRPKPNQSLQQTGGA